MKGFKRYIVKRKETLESIAINLNMKVEELRHFHNYNCDLKHLIGGNKIPRHVKEIYYPAVKSNNNTFVNNHSVNTIVSSDDNLFSQLYTSQLLHFKCKVTVTSDNNVIDFINHYSLQYFHKSDEYFYVEINYNLSQSKSSDPLSEIKEKIYSNIYPLMLVINIDGTIHDIHNFSRIKNRWFKLKNEIKKKYSIPSILNFLNRNDGIYLNKESLLQRLKNDWFLNSYFFGIFTNYNKEWEITKTINIPISSSSYTSLLVKQKIINYSEKENYIVSEIENYAKSENYLVPDNNKYTACFTLEPLFHIPHKIFINCYLENQAAKKISILITQIIKS